MTSGNLPRDETELEAFLGRKSNLSTDYHNLERVEPPASLDEKILAVARTAPKPAATAPAKPTPVQPVAVTPTAGPSPVISASPAERRKRPRPPAPDTDDDDDEDVPASRRPRWLVPAAVAATVAVGVGLAVFMISPTDTGDTPLDGSLFARRARERSEADKAAAAAAEQEAEVVEMESTPLPPPPIFEPEGPQVQDLDAAIALIRKELVLVNQTAAVAEEAAARERKAAAAAGKVAETAVEPAAPASVIQPRERRLTKILELYDGGNPDLAADSLEIFLRDFEDDPISQRILAVKP